MDTIPKIIFIVPYRNREQEKRHFIEKMTYLLEDMDKSTYKIFFIEQGNDGREFNRGAVKNIGFIMARRQYPNDYQNITLVFNDIDTLPVQKGLINYDTVPGIIKHFYGFTYTLGGIFSIKAFDFERTNGFPNYWAWGFEDNMMVRRANVANLRIDRSTFFEIGDTRIQQIQGSRFRNVNRGEFVRFSKNIQEGINSINNILYDQYDIDETMTLFYITHFDTPYPEDISKRSIHDLSKGVKPFMPGFSEKRNAKLGMQL